MPNKTPSGDSPKKTYPAWVSIAICAAALVYFISPVDIVPDLIFGFGQLDDLAVLALAATQAVHLWKLHSAKRASWPHDDTKGNKDMPPIDVEGHEMKD